MASGRKLGARLSLALECATLLFLCAGILGTFQVWRQNPGRVEAYFLVVGVPASASLLFLFVTLFVPDLLAVGRIRFPLNLTLPVVYAGLLLVCEVLWTTDSIAVASTPELITYALFWRRPETIAILCLVQCAVFSVIAALRSEE